MLLLEKIKIFIWQAAKNLLPTAENLWKRKILAHPICQICGSSSENTLHALVGCKSARKIWKISQVVAEIRTITGQDILSAIQDLVKRVGRAKAELVVTLFWVVWSARNHMLFKGEEQTPMVQWQKQKRLWKVSRGSVPQPQILALS